MASNVVQYVVLRRDLATVLKWPTGALIAQACHACTAVMHLHYNDEVTQQYLSNVDKMHKVILEAKDEKSLRTLSETLTNENVAHKLWVEQPEDIPTCVAVKPYNKDDVQKYFKQFTLFK